MPGKLNSALKYEFSEILFNRQKLLKIFGELLNILYHIENIIFRCTQQLFTSVKI